MTKQVKIQVTEGGQKYFSIYEVRVKDYNGETHTYDRYLSKKEADMTIEFIYDTFQKLYKSAWKMEHIVWC